MRKGVRSVTPFPRPLRREHRCSGCLSWTKTPLHTPLHPPTWEQVFEMALTAYLQAHFLQKDVFAAFCNVSEERLSRLIAVGAVPEPTCTCEEGTIYARASMPFSPAEYGRSSRKRLVDDLRRELGEKS